MKYRIFSFMLAVYCFSMAQENLAPAGIFRMRVYVDPKLTNSFTVSNNNQRTPIYSSFRFNQAQKDSIKGLVQFTIRNLFVENSDFIYDLKPNGVQRMTWETGSYSGGFPKMTRKRAFANYDKDLYVKIKIKVESVNGPSYGVVGVSYAKIHPTVKFKVIAFDINRKRVYSKKIRLWDFESLNSVQFNTPYTTITNTNALSPDQVYEMIRHTILTFNEGKNR